MSKFTNIKKSVNEVAQILAADDTVKKLIVNDDPSALNDDVPSDYSLNELIANHYICVIPPVESGIKDSWRNTFITILLGDSVFGRADDNTDSRLTIYITTDEAHVILDDNKNRMYELIDRICDLLDGVKISTAGKLHIDSVAHTMLSEFRSAYRMFISFDDQITKEVEI